MACPTLDRFLPEVATILQTKDSKKLQQYLLIEPPFPQPYVVLIDELRRVFPRDEGLEPLETKITALLPMQENDDAVGGSWPSFVSFLATYFAFVRDVDEKQLVQTYEQLKELIKCVSSIAQSLAMYLDIDIMPIARRPSPSATPAWASSCSTRSSPTPGSYPVSP